MEKSLVKKAFIMTLPVLTGYIVLGIGFGIILESKGYNFIWAFVMSLFIYAGSLQYVMLDLISGGATLIMTAYTSLMVNARHLFYGISMIDKYKDAGKYKPYLMFALTDETYSLVVQDLPDILPKDRHRFYFLVSLMDQCYWVAGCTLGGLIGSAIEFNAAGMDFALTALFVTIFVEQWLSSSDHLPAISGVCLSVISLLIFGPDKFLIPAMILITLALTALKFKRDKKPGKEAHDD